MIAAIAHLVAQQVGEHCKREAIGLVALPMDRTISSSLLQRRLRLFCLIAGSFAACGIAGGAALGEPVSAQPIVSRPVTQALPSQNKQRLSRALVNLAKSPDDPDALIEAGEAAFAAGDLEASLGFFQRAKETNEDDESDPRALLGLARIYLRAGRPVEALPLFDDALEAGARPRAVRSDKALAFDMVGDQSSAQQLYARLLKNSPKDDQARRRLAVSYAISDNRAGFEKTLRPLLESRDLGAFRARAFGLAIMGEQGRAEAIIDAMMPRDMAMRITPYLKSMPRLTPAQQAAAANMGIFPRLTDEIGRDPPDIAFFERMPSGTKAAGGSRRSDARRGGADRLLEPAGTPLGAKADVRAAVPKQPIEQVFGDLLAAPPPMSDANESEEGAVDLASLDVPREPPTPQPETEPAHPERIWVQIATGRDLQALGFDWRRFSRLAPELLKPFTPHTVPWGQTNRMLAGPLESPEAARQLINSLSAKGIDTFRFISPEGMEIQKLDAP